MLGMGASNKDAMNKHRPCLPSGNLDERSPQIAPHPFIYSVLSVIFRAQCGRLPSGRGRTCNSALSGWDGARSSSSVLEMLSCTQERQFCKQRIAAEGAEALTTRVSLVSCDLDLLVY